MFAETGSAALGNPPSISELIEDVTDILFSLYMSAIGAYILKFRFTVFITSLSSFYKKIENGYFRQLFLKFHVYLK